MGEEEGFSVLVWIQSQHLLRVYRDFTDNPTVHTNYTVPHSRCVQEGASLLEMLTPWLSHIQKQDCFPFFRIGIPM